MTVIAFLLGVVLAGIQPQGVPAGQAAARQDACELLAADEVRAVQGAALKGRKASAEKVRGLHFAQCFLTADDFARSVSVTLITGSAPAYWRESFHRPVTAASTRKKKPPRPVPALGEEAFWTGDTRAGTLYVLRGDTILRISVGGVPDEEERLRRTMALARAALPRVQ